MEFRINPPECREPVALHLTYQEFVALTCEAEYAAGVNRLHPRLAELAEAGADFNDLHFHRCQPASGSSAGRAPLATAKPLGVAGQAAGRTQQYAMPIPTGATPRTKCRHEYTPELLGGSPETAKAEALPAGQQVNLIA